MSFSQRSVRQELVDIKKQINNLSRQHKRAVSSSAAVSAAAAPPVPCRRSSPSSSKTIMVYVLGGYSTSMAVDFILGRGWPRIQRGQTMFHNPNQSLRDRLAKEVEQAFLEAPASSLAALAISPMKDFEFDDLLCVHKYVMEHFLYQWICIQNHDRGVAPTRSQILAQALACIPADAPQEVQAPLRNLLGGNFRKQRR